MLAFIERIECSGGNVARNPLVTWLCSFSVGHRKIIEIINFCNMYKI